MKSKKNFKKYFSKRIREKPFSKVVGDEPQSIHKLTWLHAVIFTIVSGALLFFTKTYTKPYLLAAEIFLVVLFWVLWWFKRPGRISDEELLHKYYRHTVEE